MLGYVAALFMNAPRRRNGEVITQPQSRLVAMMSHSSVRSSLSSAETERLARRGLRLAQFTVAYKITAGLPGGW